MQAVLVARLIKDHQHLLSKSQDSQRHRNGSRRVKQALEGENPSSAGCTGSPPKSGQRKAQGLVKSVRTGKGQRGVGRMGTEQSRVLGPLPEGTPSKQVIVLKGAP